jgi:cohesin loading factor subunit SCC2
VRDEVDLQCLPILVSLETHADPVVSTRALELHTTLHRKHSTLVNVRYLDFARASFQYQRGMSSEVTGALMLFQADNRSPRWCRPT